MADIAGLGGLNVPDGHHRDGDAAARTVAESALGRRARHAPADVAGFARRIRVGAGQREFRAQMVVSDAAFLLRNRRPGLYRSRDRNDADECGAYEASYAHRVHGDFPFSETDARRSRA